MRSTIISFFFILISQLNKGYCQDLNKNLNGYYILINTQSCLSCKKNVLKLIDDNPNILNKLLLTSIRNKDIPNYLVKEFGEEHSKKIVAESLSNNLFPIDVAQAAICLFKSGKLTYYKQIGNENAIWDLIDSVKLNEETFNIPQGSGFRWVNNNLYVLNHLDHDVAIYNPLIGECNASFRKSNIIDSIWKNTVSLIIGDSLSEISYKMTLKRSPKKIVDFTTFNNISIYNEKVYLSIVIDFPFINSNKDTILANYDFILECDSLIKVRKAYASDPFEINGKKYFLGRQSSVFNFTVCDDSTFLFDISEQNDEFDSINSPYIGKVRLRNQKTFLNSYCNIPSPFIQGNYGYSFQGGTTINTPIGFLAFFISLPFELNVTNCIESDLFNRMNYYNSLSDKGNYIYNRKEKILSYSPYFNPDTKNISVITREKDHFYFNRRSLISSSQNIEKYNFDSVMTGVSYFHQEGDHYWTLQLKNENWIIHHGKMPF